MEIKTYDEIMTQLERTLIARQSKLTDFNEGSVIHTILMSVARQLEKLYVATLNGYNSNLNSLALSIFNIKRKEGVFATTKCVFEIGKEVTTPITIYKNTSISDGMHTFITTQDAVIKVGELRSNTVEAIAKEVGSAYNLPLNAINKIDSIVDSRTVKVTNTAIAQGGNDKETDPALLSRFKLYLNGLQGNNKYGIQYAVMSISGVRSCNFIEHFPPVNNYNATLYVDVGTDDLTTELLEKVKDAVNTVRSAGVNIDVKGAIGISIDIDVLVTIYGKETKQAQEGIRDAINSYILSLGLGDNVVYSSLIYTIRSLSYVKGVKHLYIGNTQLSNNLIIPKDSVARIGEITVSSELWTQETEDAYRLTGLPARATRRSVLSG